MDSLTSSLLYAYLRSTHPPLKGFSKIYVPFLNIPKDKIRLRQEFALICEKAGVKTDSLLTLDEISDDVVKSENIKWLLVDHNKPTGRLAKFLPEQVIGTVDHHDEENFIINPTIVEPRVVQKAGSCTSLVVDYCRSAWDTISSSSLSTGGANGQGESAINDSAFTMTWDAQVAKLALASILIDTSNLTNPDKVEPIDEEAVAYLEAKIMLSPREAKSWKRKAFYKEIKEAKSNIGILTFEEILEKDYKQWDEGSLRLGISSVVKDLDFLSKKVEIGSFHDLVDGFMVQHDLDIFAIMTHAKSNKGERYRQIQLQAKSSAIEHAKRFVQNNENDLRLEQSPITGIQIQHSPESEGIWRTTWLQKDNSKSRKQVAPLLRAAMN